MNEIKIQVKSLFNACIQSFNLPEHPSKPDLKRIGKFITGNSLMRIEIMIDFWQTDCDMVFYLWNNFSFIKSSKESEILLSRNENKHKIDLILKGIEFDLLDGFKHWEFKKEDQLMTISEINRLLKKIEKWQYIKGYKDNYNSILSKVKKTLKARIDNDFKIPLFQFTFVTPEEIMNFKKKLRELVIAPVDQTKNEVFPQCLNHENPNKVAEICNNIFNNKYSPKVYAIMFCLLSDNGFIIVPNRSRNYYYKAWYYFINRPLPKNNNFYIINKFIIDKAANGLVFKDESDPDFLGLEGIFRKELITNNL